MKNLPARRDAALTNVEALEQQLKAIEEEYSRPDFFLTTTPENLAHLQLQQHQLRDRLSEAMSDWEALESEITVLESELGPSTVGELA